MFSQPLQEPCSRVSKEVQCKQTVLTVFSSPSQSHSFASLGSTVGSHSSYISQLTPSAHLVAGKLSGAS